MAINTTMVEHELALTNKIAEYVNARLGEFLNLKIINEDQFLKMSKIITDENVKIHNERRGMINCH